MLQLSLTTMRQRLFTSEDSEYFCFVYLTSNYDKVSFFSTSCHVKAWTISGDILTSYGIDDAPERASYVKQNIKPLVCTHNREFLFYSTNLAKTMFSLLLICFYNICKENKSPYFFVNFSIPFKHVRYNHTG